MKSLAACCAIFGALLMLISMIMFRVIAIPEGMNFDARIMSVAFGFGVVFFVLGLFLERRRRGRH